MSTAAKSAVGAGKGGKGGRGKVAGKKSQSKSSKAGLQFPVGRMGRFLKKCKYATRDEADKRTYLQIDITHTRVSSVQHLHSVTIDVQVGLTGTVRCRRQPLHRQQ